MEGPQSWQENALKKSGARVSDWELEPKETQRQEATIETAPDDTVEGPASILQKPERSNETPEIRAAKIDEVNRRLVAFSKSAEIKSPETEKEQAVPSSVSPREDLGVLGKTSIFLKHMFGKELNPKEKEYRVAYLSSDFDKLMQEGDFKLAYKRYSDISEERGMHDHHSHEEVEIKDAMLNAIIAGNDKTFSKLFKLNQEHLLPILPIEKEELGLKENESVNPKISQIIFDHIANKMKGINISRNNLASWYLKTANDWVGSGLISREELNSLPTVKEALRKDIIYKAKIMLNKDSLYGTGVEGFEEYLGEVESTGIFSKQEVKDWTEIKRLLN